MQVSLQNFHTISGENLMKILWWIDNYFIFWNSDHIALLKAFEGWKDAKRNRMEKSFCWENFLSPVAMQMIEDMRNQFLDLLAGIGFVDKARGAKVSVILCYYFNGQKLLCTICIMQFWQQKKPVHEKNWNIKLYSFIWRNTTNI